MFGDRVDEVLKNGNMLRRRRVMMMMMMVMMMMMMTELVVVVEVVVVMMMVMMMTSKAVVHMCYKQCMRLMTDISDEFNFALVSKVLLFCFFPDMTFAMDIALNIV